MAPARLFNTVLAGESMKEKLLEMFQVTVSYNLMNLFLFGFTKNATGVKTAPRAPKLGNKDLVPG